MSILLENIIENIGTARPTEAFSYTFRANWDNRTTNVMARVSHHTRANDHGHAEWLICTLHGEDSSTEEFGTIVPTHVVRMEHNAHRMFYRVYTLMPLYKEGTPREEYRYIENDFAEASIEATNKLGAFMAPSIASAYNARMANIETKYMVAVRN